MWWLVAVACAPSNFCTRAGSFLRIILCAAAWCRKSVALRSVWPRTAGVRRCTVPTCSMPSWQWKNRAAPCSRLPTPGAFRC